MLHTQQMVSLSYILPLPHPDSQQWLAQPIALPLLRLIAPVVLTGNLRHRWGLPAALWVCADPSLALLFQTLSLAVKHIAAKVSRAGLEGLYGTAEQQGGGSGDVQKKLDVVAVRVLGMAWGAGACNRHALSLDKLCSG